VLQKSLFLIAYSCSWFRAFVNTIINPYRTQMLKQHLRTLNYNIANVASTSWNVDSDIAETFNVCWIYVLQMLQFNIDSTFIQLTNNANFICIIYISYLKKLNKMCKIIFWNYWKKLNLKNNIDFYYLKLILLLP